MKWASSLSLTWRASRSASEKNHDRGDAEIPTGPNDPDRDLPSIGDENLFKQIQNLEPGTWNAREARS